MDIAIKTCRACLTEKPLTDYERNRRMKDGLMAYCKPCARRIRHGARVRDIRNEHGEPTFYAPTPAAWKPCAACSRILALADYPENPKARDGRGGICTACRAEDSRERYRDPEYALLNARIEKQRERVRREQVRIRGYEQNWKAAQERLAEIESALGELLGDFKKQRRK